MSNCSTDRNSQKKRLKQRNNSLLFQIASKRPVIPAFFIARKNGYDEINTHSSKGKGPCNQSVFIYCTVPDKDTAAAIGRKLVEGRLAACVSVGSPVRSIYRWQGVIEETTELEMTIKTAQENYLKVEELILSMHPYEVPEIVMVELDKGLKPYLDWIESETK